MAIHANSTHVPLSPLFTDPFVRRAFERVERDDGQAAVLAFRPGPRLFGGSAAAMPGLLRGSRRPYSCSTVTRQPVSNRLAPNYPAASGVVEDGTSAKQTARRKVIYEELHPETRLGENQHTRVRQVGEATSDRFTAETASSTGKSERAGLLRRERQPAQKFMQVADRFGSKSVTVTDLPPSVLYALAAAGLSPAALPRLRAQIESTIEEMIDVLDMLDAAGEDMEPTSAGFFGPGDDREDEDEHGTDLDHGEADHADDEPYFSVVEWNGHGDNWRRSGQPTDIEEVNEDGDIGRDPHWWGRSAHPVTEADHV